MRDESPTSYMSCIHKIKAVARPRHALPIETMTWQHHLIRGYVSWRKSKSTKINNEQIVDGVIPGIMNE